MRAPTISLLLGGLFGSSAVAFDAYVGHVLRPSLSAHDAESIAVALRYQLIHSGMLVLIGTLLHAEVAAPLNVFLRGAAWMFVLGILLFCGSISIGVVLSLHSGFPLAPLGGCAFMVGWLMLGAGSFVKTKV